MSLPNIKIEGSTMPDDITETYTLSGVNLVCQACMQLKTFDKGVFAHLNRNNRFILYIAYLHAATFHSSNGNGHKKR